MCRVSKFFSLYSPSASRNVSDWWLAYWISHSRTTNSTKGHVNSRTAYHWNHVMPKMLTADQLGMHVHIVKDTVTFYLVVYGGLAVANTVRLFLANKECNILEDLCQFFTFPLEFVIPLLSLFYRGIKYLLDCKIIIFFALVRHTNARGLRKVPLFSSKSTYIWNIRPLSEQSGHQRELSVFIKRF